MTHWTNALRCPCCQAELRDLGRCDGCSAGFPDLDGIPVLMEHARSEMLNWRYRLHDLAAACNQQRERIAQRLDAQTLSVSTRHRLSSLREGLDVQRDRILALFADAGLTPERRARPDRARVPIEGQVTAYYPQLHRDWAWDDREVMDALEAIVPVVDETSFGRVLVLGAGGCRLAAELHQRFHAQWTLGIDTDPLALLVARRLLAGQRVRLPELPLRPRSAAWVDRDLGPRPPVGNLHLLLADGLTPPLRDGSVNTVVTPWFLDQVPRDAAAVLGEIRRVLAPGGRWVHHGPAVYHPRHTRIEHRYTFEELCELAHAAGFEIERQRETTLAFLQSPIGCAGRTERVLTFSAVRLGD